MYPLEKMPVSGQHGYPATGRAIQACDLIRNADNLLLIRIELVAPNPVLVREWGVARDWVRRSGLPRCCTAGIVHDKAICDLDDALRTAEIRRKLHDVTGEIPDQIVDSENIRSIPLEDRLVVVGNCEYLPETLIGHSSQQRVLSTIDVLKFVD